MIQFIILLKHNAHITTKVLNIFIELHLTGIGISDRETHWKACHFNKDGEYWTPDYKMRIKKIWTHIEYSHLLKVWRKLI